jgi:hypothetical protein
MNPLLDQLHDIDGLDAISWWPLAIGWWITIALGTALGIALLGYAVYRLAYSRSWKNDTLKKLAHLQQNLSDTTARETAIALSEYLRRIALRRFTRKECASLIGETWLMWLTKHDPKQFDWKTKGIFLINLPYAPENATVPVEQVQDLIQAAKNWVK